MKKNIFKSIENEISITANENVGVGVSGGVDSMVLLHSLLHMRKKIDFNIIVVHVNHNLRGAESDRDEDFVRDFCNANKIQFECANVNVKQNKDKYKLTEEESARILRYEIFEKIINKYSINQFFLAHHANDQAETVLMHIFRGSGTAGGIGMKKESKYKRPMLNISRKEILAAADEYKIDYVLDSTNNEDVCNRNVLRNKILPEIEKIYPGVIGSICKFADNLKSDQDFIDQALPKDLLVLKKDKVSIKLKTFTLHNALKFRLIKKAFNHLGVFADVLSKHIDSVIDLANLQNGAKVDMPHGVIAVKEYDFITLYNKRENEKLFSKNMYGQINLGKFNIVVTEVQKNDVCYGDGNLYACLDGIKNLVWRTVEKNDKFCKLGASGSKKLVDYFTDKKIPQMCRLEIPLLASGNEILVVAGYDISDKVKIKENSSLIVRISCLTNE